MIRALILDDEKASLTQLRESIERYIPDITQIWATSDPAEAMMLINEQHPQLLFLDIEMPQMNGFEFLEKIKERNFAVIFTTAFSQYAIKALRFSALDYLLKPVQEDELKKAVERFREQPVALEQMQKLYEQLFENVKSGHETGFKLSLQTGNRIYFIAPDEITWCKGDNNYTLVYTKDGREFTMSKTLKDVDEMLQPFGFLRSHKSSLVNAKEVTALDNEELVLKSGVRIPVSRRRMEDVKSFLSGKGKE
ncbi:MAG: response regulator transcription factor [Bacteroidetes bacterium]|jgi:two-component system LytT family response regulator|nr:response regulator transcription factor [Bacteroidota bacterium]